MLIYQFPLHPVQIGGHGRRYQRISCNALDGNGLEFDTSDKDPVLHCLHGPLYPQEAHCRLSRVQTQGHCGLPAAQTSYNSRTCPGNSRQGTSRRNVAQLSPTCLITPTTTNQGRSENLENGKVIVVASRVVGHQVYYLQWTEGRLNEHRKVSLSHFPRTLYVARTSSLFRLPFLLLMRTYTMWLVRRGVLLIIINSAPPSTSPS
jgi:hypothetical protein